MSKPVKTRKKSKVNLTNEQLQKRCNEATKKLLNLFSYTDSGKQSLEYILVGWAGRDFPESDEKEERSGFMEFILKLSRHLEAIEVLDEIAPKELIALENFSFFEAYKLKIAKKYFKTMFHGFIEEDVANDKDIRFMTIYNLDVVKEYSLSVIKLLH